MHRHGNNLSQRSGFNYPIAAEVIRIFVQYYVAKIVKQYFANSVLLSPLYSYIVTLILSSRLTDTGVYAIFGAFDFMRAIPREDFAAKPREKVKFIATDFYEKYSLYSRD
ncbi:hypothetical protein NIES4101_58600 [Calothrix sp. NIES-4101]|nr:hypothetical protein NIES4101_58600 [Calothrix sp. NIES-4101]